MPMVITDTPTLPFDKVYMDMVGPLPETYSGNRYILTFQDDLTKYMDCAAIPDAEATTVAKIFYEEIITRYRIPKVLIADNGTNFTSSLFSHTCKLLGIKKLHITAYHPQANGSLERSHRPLAEYLRSFVANDERNWDQWLRQAMHVHNNTPHAATKLTPLNCLFGFHFEMPTNLKRKPAPVYNVDDYPTQLKYQLQKTYEIAKKNLEQAKITSKKGYDRTANPVTFKVGQKVLMKNPTRKNKFSPIWVGPYEVIAINGPVTTSIKINGKVKKIHNNRIKNFNN